MTRDTETVPFTPSRRPVYRQAGIVGQEQGQAASDFARSTQDWVQDRNQQRLTDYLNARSSPSGGLDAILAMANGQRLSATSLGSGTQIRVPHQLARKPTAIVWYNTLDPTDRLVGNPDGQAGGFPNSPWTDREVFVNTNAAAGVIFDIIIG